MTQSKMKEVEVAASYVLRLISKKVALSSEQILLFKQAFHDVLQKRFENHWFPEKPMRGCAYRCLDTTNWRDPVWIQISVRSCLPALRHYIPAQLTLWINPGEVSVCFGEGGSSCALFHQDNVSGQVHVNYLDEFESEEISGSTNNSKTTTTRASLLAPIAARQETTGSSSSRSSSPLSSSEATTTSRTSSPSNSQLSTTSTQQLPLMMNAAECYEETSLPEYLVSQSTKNAYEEQQQQEQPFVDSHLNFPYQPVAQDWIQSQYYWQQFPAGQATHNYHYQMTATTTSDAINMRADSFY